MILEAAIAKEMTFNASITDRQEVDFNKCL